MESPGLYGMHPNAEIELMTATSDDLFRTLLELQPRDSTTGDGTTQCIEEKVLITLCSNYNSGSQTGCRGGGHRFCTIL